jgi:membrane protein YqaA with SNARE-associated domain
MKQILETLIAWGPLGIFIFGVVDGAGLPSPGGVDWLLVLLSARSPARAYSFAGMAILGSVIGCLILYYLARRAGEKMLVKYRSRPRFVRFENWFQHYGVLTVFIPALVPIPMPLKFFVICAGVFEVPPMTFFLVILVARVPRYLGLAYVGSNFGGEWMRAHVWHMIGFAAGLFVFLYLLIVLAERRKKLTAIE